MAIDHTASLVNLETGTFDAPAGVGIAVRIDAPARALSVILQAADDLLVSLVDKDGVAIGASFGLVAGSRHVVWLSGVIPGGYRGHPSGQAFLSVASSVAGVTPVIFEYRS